MLMSHVAPRFLDTQTRKHMRAHSTTTAGDYHPRDGGGDGATAQLLHTQGIANLICLGSIANLICLDSIANLI